MTLPYRQKFLAYLGRYALPKCLRMVKLWVWDIRGQMEQSPDPTEDGIVQERHLRDVIATAHDYDGVSTSGGSSMGHVGQCPPQGKCINYISTQ